MTAIGLDIGSSFVKCVSDTSRVIFPSVYAYRTRQKWEGSSGIVAGVGEDALKIAAYPNSVVIRPTIEGRPVHQVGVESLVKEAVSRVHSSSLSGLEKGLNIVTGLPYDAADNVEILKSCIETAVRPGRCSVVPQVIGTLSSMGKRSTTIMDIGHGTTEMVAVEDMELITGESFMQACDYILRDYGEFSFIDRSIMDEFKDEIIMKSRMLAEILSNRLESFVSVLKARYECSKVVIITGGGLLMPGLKDALLERLRIKVEMPEDPVMSNAIGLHAMANRLAAP